ncbi:hypothetical protein CBR_g23514 [Chara braunii]|uniref:Uncharacterized protein n=1 Tax=Chara braunii TaxID=69332 RepID=A0A388L4G2_CHABU|nr:hypothetical protein CBR_g23514 [Chara braunii]|eukprot:GBG77187.1 hypothetical protein CBR_g23514 [Chara braunii]
MPSSLGSTIRECVEWVRCAASRLAAKMGANVSRQVDGIFSRSLTFQTAVDSSFEELVRRYPAQVVTEEEEESKEAKNDEREGKGERSGKDVDGGSTSGGELGVMYLPEAIEAFYVNMAASKGGDLEWRQFWLGRRPKPEEIGQKIKKEGLVEGKVLSLEEYRRFLTELLGTIGMKVAARRVSFYVAFGTLAVIAVDRTLKKIPGVGRAYETLTTIAPRVAIGVAIGTRAALQED